MQRKIVWFVPALLCFASFVAAAAVIEVTPTGTAVDFDNVRSALASAHPGDTVLLRAGTFNWSGNTAVIPPFVVAAGLPIPVSGITIAGETAANGTPLTIISGPVDADGYPAVYNGYYPFNGGFINLPSLTGLTIRNLVLRNFEQAIGLLQGPAGVYDGYALDGTAFSTGADDSLIENLRIENCTGGITALGAHNRLTVRNNTFQIVAKDGLRDDSGGLMLNPNAITASYAQNPDFPDAPSGLVIENNTLVGPGPYPQRLITLVTDPDTGETSEDGPFWVFSVGMGVTGANGLRIQGNTITGFGEAIFAAAQGAVQISGNKQSNGQIGLSLADLSPVPKCKGVPGSASAGVTSGATNGALVRNNRFTDNVYFPALQSYWLAGGVGIILSADNNQFVGNNLEGNEIAGIRLREDSCTDPVRPNRTATGNLILGNHNVVVGTDYVLQHNTISGSKTSRQNVGEAIGDLPPEQRPPRKLQ